MRVWGVMMRVGVCEGLGCRKYRESFINILPTARLPLPENSEEVRQKMRVTLGGPCTHIAYTWAPKYLNRDYLKANVYTIQYYMSTWTLRVREGFPGFVGRRSPPLTSSFPSGRTSWMSLMAVMVKTIMPMKLMVMVALIRVIHDVDDQEEMMTVMLTAMID